MDKFIHFFKAAKEAAFQLPLFSDSKRAEVITTLADLIELNESVLLNANEADLNKMDKSNPLYDRLKLSHDRLQGIASDLRNVAALNSPLGEVLEHRTLPNGIDLKKIRVPFGVVGAIYEARPNVTFDIFALCLKSGNVAILKGGKDAVHSNEAIISLIHSALKSNGITENACILLPSTHEATEALLNAVGYVDVCIPRGGRNLIDFVRLNAKVPVIETGAGVVHLYFDKEGDAKIAQKVVDNAKTRRVSVCNALDALLVHKDRIKELEFITAPLAQKNVELYCDSFSLESLKKFYPKDLLHEASPEDADKEWMDMKMGVFVVESLQDAIIHINRHGSGHSESIVTDNQENADEFCKTVDAACVYVNLPTSFTDGAQFGLGAEVGISTQKLGPRGPMGLSEITTYKYILSGRGQIRKP